MPNPVHYAENVLRVHATYDHGVELTEQLEQAQFSSAQLGSALRQLREQLAQREAQVLQSIYGDPAISASRADQLFKIDRQQDETCSTLRSEILDQQQNLDLAEAQVSSLKAALALNTARLHELAGLLAFYAARTPPLVAVTPAMASGGIGAAPTTDGPTAKPTETRS